MTPNTLQLQRNLPFRTVNQAKGSPFLSLRAIPFLIVLISSLAIQPAVGASPVVKTIQVASLGACGIVASPNRSEVYVACTHKSGGIEVIDTVTNELSFHIATAASATGIGISPDGKTLYVTETEELVEFGVWHPPQGFLEAISLTTFKQLFLVPLPSFDPLILGVASNGGTVYVPDETTGNVTPFGGPFTSSVSIGERPQQVVFNHNNTSAYVTNLSDIISVINTANGSVDSFKTAVETSGLAIAGTTLFATGKGHVFVINTDTNKVIRTITVPTPGEMTFPALTRDGVFLYIPVAVPAGIFFGHPVPGEVVVINTKTDEVVQTFSVGQLPVQVATAANNIYGYVTNFLDGTVTVFQLAH
jgi:YVTN family beta-propeller protein